MNGNREGFRVLGLTILAFLSGLLSVVVLFVLMATTGRDAPMLGTLISLLTAPLAALILGFQARNVERGLCLGAIVGVTSGYGFFVTLFAMGQHMVWFPCDLLLIFFFLVVPGLINGVIGGFGADRSSGAGRGTVNPMDDSSTGWFRVSRLLALAVLGGLLSIIVSVMIGMIGGPLALLSLLIVGPLVAYSLGQKTREEMLGLLLGATVGLTGGYGAFLMLSFVGSQVTGHISALPQSALAWFGYIVAPLIICGFMGRQGTDSADVY